LGYKSEGTGKEGECENYGKKILLKVDYYKSRAGLN